MSKIEQVREAIEACIDRLPDIPSYQKCKAALAILKDMDGQEPVADQKTYQKDWNMAYVAALANREDIEAGDKTDAYMRGFLYSRAHPSQSAPVVPVPQVRTWTEEEVLAMVRNILREVMYSHVTDSIMRSHEVQSVQTTSIISIAAKHGLTI